MAISKRRIKEVVSFANNNSDQEASEKYDLNISTIKRYRRKANELGIEVLEYDNPNILLIDIETAPIETYSWGAYKQYIDPKYIKKDHSIITYAAKWLCQTDIICNKVTTSNARERKDRKVVKEIHELFDKADIIIAHNLKRFDEKSIKKRFIMNNLEPPSPYQTVDTLKEVRREFNFTSNKLDYLNERFGISNKQDVDFNLWHRCVTGDKEALEKMLEYNKQDIRALEDLYFEIRGWIKSHPNVGLYYNDIEDRCPNCGSKDIEYNGTYNTRVNEYDAFKCSNCGAYARSRHTNTPEEVKARLKKPVAR